MPRRILATLLLAALLGACDPLLDPDDGADADVAVQVLTPRVAPGAYAVVRVRNDAQFDRTVLTCLNVLEARAGSGWSTLGGRACPAVVGAGEVTLAPGETLVDSLQVPAGTADGEGRFVVALASIEGAHLPWQVASGSFEVD